MKTKDKELIKKVYLVANSQIFPLQNKISKIGRKLDNDIVIQDSMISRYHAEIIFDDAKYYLEDKNSTGGTFLNNERIEKVQINSGDTFILADTPLLFLIESQELNINSDFETGNLSSENKMDTESADETTKPFKK